MRTIRLVNQQGDKPSLLINEVNQMMPVGTFNHFGPLVFESRRDVLTMLNYCESLLLNNAYGDSNESE